jgi:class 3 adenylate cyclase
MSRPPSRILVVDDTVASAKVLRRQLEDAGYAVAVATSGTQGLQMALREPPDLVLLDVVMPDLDGFEVCRQLRADARFAATPIVLVTAHDADDVRLEGFGAGAVEFLGKPVPERELVARVKSLLQVKSLYDELERQRAELADWSRLLEDRVEQKLREIECLSRLTRFFSPALAQRILATGGDDALHSHRREVTVLFADLRGFTAFAEMFEPAVVMQVLRDFHAAMGTLIHRHEGTLERFTGDGMMVFFNDPDIVVDHAERALRLAFDMMAQTLVLHGQWAQQGVELSLAIGLARGMATLGTIGFESRVDYAAIGRVTNLAARLCAEALPWEVLASESMCPALETLGLTGERRWLTLKGFALPVPVFTIVRATV